MCPNSFEACLAVLKHVEVVLSVSKRSGFGTCSNVAYYILTLQHFVNLIHVVTAKGFRNSHTKFSFLYGWNITVSNMGVLIF